MNNQEQRGSLYLWRICNLNLFSCKFQRYGEPCFYSVGLCGGFKMDAGNIAFMLICSALVFLMTPGLAMFYGGLVRKKNVVNTMMTSIFIRLSAAMVFR